MISAFLFILFAMALFYFVVSPLFENFKEIPFVELEDEAGYYEKSNLEELKNDLENGKISEEELDEIRENLKKEIKDE